MRPDGRLTLYLDWCTVRGRYPFPLTADLLAAFAADTGRTPGIGMVRVVLAEQIRQGLPTTPDEGDSGVTRRGDPALLRAVARCPSSAGGSVRWVHAVTGRRDALILVTLWAGLSRRQTVGLTAADLTDGGLLADLGCRCDRDDGDLTHRRTAGACPRHVRDAWADLLPALRSGSRWRVQQLVAGEACGESALDTGCDETTPGDAPLLFSVDRHGWAEPERPLSMRAVTAICAVRLARAERSEAEATVALPLQGTREVGSDGDWDDLFDRLDAMTDDLDARAAELLTEARSQAAWLDAAWLRTRP